MEINTLHKHTDRIKSKIAEDKTEEALELLLNLIKENAGMEQMENILIELKARLKALDSKALSNTISDKTYSRHKSTITENALKLLNQVEEILIASNAKEQVSNELIMKNDLSRNFRRKKNLLIELLDSFLALGFDLNKNDLNELESIRRDKFTIAVAGAVKAGKSTLINAFLRKDILPTDSLQATSVIINIEWGNEYCIEVLYANGETKRNEGFENVKNELKKIGSVSARFKEIPAGDINNYIIKNKSQEGLPPDEDIVKKFKNHSRIENEIFIKLIKEYYNIYKNSKNIPVSVKISANIQDWFSEVRLVDTPGISAIGGISEKTLEYLENSETKPDTLIIAHNLKIPVEGSEIWDFVDRLPDSLKKNNILVLTHATSDSDADRKHEELSTLFWNFTKNNTIKVDSICKMIYDDLLNYGNVKAMLKFYNEELSSSNNDAERALIKEKITVAKRIYYENDDNEDFDHLDEFLKKSNFQEFTENVIELSQNTPFDKIKSGFRLMQSILSVQVKNLDKLYGLVSQDEIIEIKNEINSLKINIKKTNEIKGEMASYLDANFLKRDSKWRKKTRQNYKRFKNRVKAECEESKLIAAYEKLEDKLDNVTDKVEKKIKEKVNQSRIAEIDEDFKLPDFKDIYSYTTKMKKKFINTKSKILKIPYHNEYGNPDDRADFYREKYESGIRQIVISMGKKMKKKQIKQNRDTIGEITQKIESIFDSEINRLSGNIKILNNSFKDKDKMLKELVNKKRLANEALITFNSKAADILD